MRQFQSMSKGGEARDFNLIQDNSNYVQTWSIAQIVVVILSTVIQVIHLFLPSSQTGGEKDGISFENLLNATRATSAGLGHLTLKNMTL